jgi:hypothetical protein
MDIIKQIRETNQIDRKISDCLILINSLDDKVKEKIEADVLREYLDELMHNHDFRRQVNVRNQMMNDTEEALCYLMSDYVTDQEHTYNEELEGVIIEIEGKIRQFLAKVIKELVSDEIVI